jgi:hypothetical protein
MATYVSEKYARINHQCIHLYSQLKQKKADFSIPRSYLIARMFGRFVLSRGQRRVGTALARRTVLPLSIPLR